MSLLGWRLRILQRKVIAGARAHRRPLATVAVGISGGVDSSVAALLLQREGHDVIGIHMTNWNAAEEGAGAESCTEVEARDARRVCEQLGIGFHRVNFVRDYWHSVFTPMLEGYDQGGTPNPDVACNRFIKFDKFHAHALELGADWVATGHYARIGRDGAGGATLLRAADDTKDQTYFLALVRQEALRRSRFPLGALHKTEVRSIASEAGLLTASKRDSMGICFIGKRDFGDFIESYLPQAPGDFECIESGRVVGRHKGYALYTPSQRARIGGQSTRWYVVDKDIETNVVRVAEGAHHPALFTRSLTSGVPSWVGGVAPSALTEGCPLRCSVRVRHPGAIFGCTVELQRPNGGGAPSTLRVWLDEPVSGVAELQSIALYDGDICLGGATILERGPTLWEEARGLRRVGWGSSVANLPV
jgi:tRNA (5-methylaminomethyl-2-thiouridylate)-methyltransferase